MTREESIRVAKEAWEAYKEREKKDPVRLKEIENKSMDFGEVTMRYGVSVIGEPGVPKKQV